MNRIKRNVLTAPVVTSLLLTLCWAWPAIAQNQSGQNEQASNLPGIKTGQAFEDRWWDGQAELAAYDLTFPRYGQKREGTAVTIFVAETFSQAQRVKADTSNPPEGNRFPVMKLNLVQDFQTGVYDYNLMTSAFVTLDPKYGRPAGTPTKVAFSSQEWCGQLFDELLFNRSTIRQTLHSYFAGEADQRNTLDYPMNGISEDALLLWARGLAAPRLKPGQSMTLPVLLSLETARLQHKPVTWTKATFTRGDKTEQITVPAGQFKVRRCTAKFTDGRRRQYFVEAQPPHRLIRWTTSRGKDVRLVGAKRMKYWQMNAKKFDHAVEALGLKPRPARTP